MRQFRQKLEERSVLRETNSKWANHCVDLSQSKAQRVAVAITK